MITGDPGWELHRSFLAVVRERSLSGAARTLDLTQPTVGRHIDALEEALGGSLFTRSQTGLLPTSLALALVPYAETMASAAEALLRVASGDVGEERGSVRLTASEMIGTEVLPRYLATFREKHPNIAVELVVTNRSEDLLRREADVAIRMVKPTQRALVAKKLGVLHLGLHAAPTYVARHGKPRTMAELMNHPLIGFDRIPALRSVPKTAFPLSREMFSFRSDSDYAQYAAMKAGYGVGVCQLALGKRDGLVALLPDVLRLPLDVWVVMHQDAKTNRRVRLLYDHLAESLREYIESEKD